MAQPRPPSLSAELFVIPAEEAPGSDRWLVYAPLRRSAFVASGEVVNLIADLAEGRRAPSLEGDGELARWLRWLGMVDGGDEPRPIRQRLGDPDPTGVTLFLTTACSLRCTYCYAAAGDSPARAMPLQVALRGIDHVSANAARLGAPGFQLAFHGGGEPTLNWPVLTGAHRHAMERARQLGLGCTTSLATNGVLSESQADWIAEHLDGASLSVDGDPVAQDAHRPAAGGGGSSRRVMQTIRRFDARGFPYGLRVTVTADQLPRLAQSIEFLCRHAHPRGIQVEPAYQLGRGSQAPSPEARAFVQAFREARAVARGHGLELSFSAARLGLLTDHFCGVSEGTFALSPDGNVSACYEAFSEDQPLAREFFYGSPAADGGYRFDREAMERLRHHALEHHDFCRGCYARWHCAGDCAHNALAARGGAPFAGTGRCHITRALIRDQLLERIAAGGGLAWKG